MTDGAEVLGGVDLGGTKIEAVVLRGGDVIARRRVPTPRAEGYEAIVDAVAGLARALAAEAGLAAVPPLGVGMPGGVTWRTPTGARSPFPLVKNSTRRASTAAPSETTSRARSAARRAWSSRTTRTASRSRRRPTGPRGVRVAFGVILGTGVGGGVVVADAGGVPRLWPGAQGIAGEWGHVALEPRDGPPCYCGRRGCVETFVSGPALEAAHTAATGEHLALAEIARRAVGDDEPARATLARAAALVGRALAYVVNVLARRRRARRRRLEPPHSRTRRARARPPRLQRRARDADRRERPRRRRGRPRRRAAGGVRCARRPRHVET